MDICKISVIDKNVLFYCLYDIFCHGGLEMGKLVVSNNGLMCISRIIMTENDVVIKFFSWYCFDLSFCLGLGL